MMANVNKFALIKKTTADIDSRFFFYIIAYLNYATGTSTFKTSLIARLKVSFGNAPTAICG